METNQQNPKQISLPKENEKSFIERNIVGVIVFCLFILYDFLRSSSLAGMLIGTILDIPVGLLLASIVQLVFNGLRKLFAK